jgi:hypothetical protein
MLAPADAESTVVGARPDGRFFYIHLSTAGGT